MKYVFLLIILLVCGLAYIHAEQPDLWNKMVKAMNLPNLAIVPDKSAPGEAAATSPEAATNTAPRPAAPKGPEYIHPSSTNIIYTDHIREIEQPTQPAASTNQPGTPPAPQPQ